MSFSDIFKSNFLENINSITILDIVLAIVLAFGIGLFIFYIYQKTYSGVLYSASFGTSLVALTMITTMVILAVTSNVVLSLGMVGALSIVRFRSAIKEAMDIAFLFWAVAAGIVLAAGMLPLAVFGSVVIGIMLLVFANRQTHSHPYIAIIRCDGSDSEKAAKGFLEKHVVRCIIKSKTATKGKVEVNYEIRLKEDNTDFVNALADQEGIESAVLVSYNGDYMN